MGTSSLDYSPIQIDYENFNSPNVLVEQQKHQVFYYTFNNNRPYNITIFEKYKNQIGIYYGVEFSPHSHKADISTNFEVRKNSVKSTDGSPNDNWYGIIMDNSYKNIALNFGLTNKLKNLPLWLSLGVGINYSDVDTEGIINYWGANSENIWMNNKDESGFNTYVETDLLYNILGGFFVRAGIRYKDDINFQVGLGINILY